MQVAQELSGGNHELQILGVGVSLRYRRMVIEHQQNPGEYENAEGAEGQRAQIPSGVEVEHAPPHLGREEVEEDVLLDRHRVAQRALARAATENRAPDPRLLQLVELF